MSRPAYRVRVRGRRLAAPTTTTRGPGAYAGMDDGRGPVLDPERRRQHWQHYWQLREEGDRVNAELYFNEHRHEMQR